MSFSDTPISQPCEGLYDIVLGFGSEQESLPDDCASIYLGSAKRAQPGESRLTIKAYGQNLLNPGFVISAVRTSVIVGSLIFVINHGNALVDKEITRNRWLAGALSFVTPYLVSIYGQA